MKFCSLGSGSEGNSLVIQSHDQYIMIDCGFGWKEMQARLESKQIPPASILGIFITHEHADHISGVDKLANRYHIPVFASFGTFNGAPRISEKLLRMQPFDSHEASPIQIGPFSVEPFTVPHDAKEPTQYVVQSGHLRLGILTDVGCSTPNIIERLNQLDGLVLEFNHDEDMLIHSKYPPSLKHRIGGKFGHLSNQQAIHLLRKLDTSELQILVAAHLSKENNQPMLVKALIETTDIIDCETIIATQSSGFDWVSLQ
ncbi:MBL fold metallo-hydrolase [Leeia sp. TBRC 13508]|uniref:MBL fold metallo-hydrolase n=1 Tax=Leeia speluncae TaxID=2884804 RepID=A0ABS8D1B8_9NEIS|nr:MBL fold metallo-hydrolase [Leeia speluncae]MCB6181987.1 MBL fold metallo-hydrolase [Leeia speluncae]